MNTPVLRSCLLTTLFISLFVSSFAQTVSLSEPENLNVCGTAVFTVTITNNESGPLADGTMLVELTDCMEYVPGSVSGATELAIGDLQNPEFGISNLMPGEMLEVYIQQEAGCDCVDLINAAEPFNNSVTVAYNGNFFSLSSPNYPVETPLLVITETTNTLLSGQLGDVFQRTFTVRNTRFGPLESFTFRDSYQPGIAITAAPGTVLIDQPGLLEVELTGSDFQQIGDGDNLFEIDEEITITETIEIIDCGYDYTSSLSDITIAWGCDNTTCQEAQQNAVVVIEETFGPEPELTFEPFTTVPHCFCGPDGHLQGLEITNTGIGTAFNLKLEIEVTDDGQAIDPASVMMDSIGGTVSLPATGSGDILWDMDCIAPDPVFTSVIFTVPALAPGETIFVHWNAYFCRQECQSPGLSWAFGYSFGISCPEGQVLSMPGPFPVEAEAPALYQELVVPPDCQAVSSGEICAWQFVVSHDTLDAAVDGFLALEFFLDCGFTWLETSAPDLGGTAATTFSVIDLDSVTVVYLEYPLPLSADSLALDFSVGFDCDSLCAGGNYTVFVDDTSCPVSDLCITVSGSDVNVSYVTTLNLCASSSNACAMQACGMSSFDPSCGGQIDTIGVPTSGYFFYGLESTRNNFGLPDNDNDRLPDAAGDIDLNAVALNHFLPGDTLLTQIPGIIMVDSVGTNFDSIELVFQFLPQADPFLNTGLFSGSGIEVLVAEVAIVDFSSGNTYNCELPPPDSINADQLGLYYTYQFPVSDLNCGLPAGFVLDQLDSLSFTFLTSLNVNPVQENSTVTLPPVVPIAVTAFTQVYAAGEELESVSCGCDVENIYLVGYQYSWTNGVFIVPPCDTSDFLGANFYSFSLPANDLFPYEYRWGSMLDEIRMTVPPGFTLTESRVNRIQWQNSIPFLLNEPLPGFPAANDWFFYLESFQQPRMDEGFSVLTQHRFLRDCQLEGAFPLQTEIRADLLPQFPESDTLILTDESNSLRALNPDLTLSTVNAQDISADNKFRWELTLANEVNSIANQTSGDALHVWLIPDVPSGQINNFILEDLTNGTELTPVNGIFQLGDFAPEEIRELRLIGENLGCGSDLVNLRYGWNCEPLTSIDEEPCFGDVLPLEGVSPDGALEMQVFSPVDTCFFLCDTVPYHTVEIFNADLGAVCEPQLRVFVPAGFVIQPGSSQLSYPEGTPFVDIPDPVDLGNGQFLYDFATVNDSLGTNCLAGIAAEPDNRLQLRFLGNTDCDFTINTTLLFRADGKQTCLDPTNSVLRESEPFCIETDAPDGQAFLNVGFENDLVCTDTVVTSLVSLLDVETATGDSLLLVLPPGISYVPGSSTPVQNGPAGEPGITFFGQQQVLSWALPSGVPAQTVISLEVTLSGFSGLPCGDTYGYLRLTRETEAFCAADGQSCSVQFELGGELIVFPIERPVLEITSFTLSGVPAGPGSLELTYQIGVENTGAVFNQDVTVQVYADLDNSGDVSAGDFAVATEVLSDFTSSGLVSGTASLPVGAACSLLAVIDPDTNCTCSGDVASAEGAIELALPTVGPLCSGETGSLGYCLPGFSSVWSDTTYLNCMDCCPAEFSYINPEEGAVTFTYAQTLTNAAGCLLEAEQEVSILPVAEIEYADTAICFGESANLLATAGMATYVWTGPDIQDPQTSGQTVSPAATAWYTLMATDTAGCVYEDSVLIVVNPLPIADAGTDTTYCIGSPAGLDAQTDPDWTYAWSPADLVTDASLPNPELTMSEPAELILTVSSSAGCANTDTVAVDFVLPPEVVVPEDFLLCLGLSDTLQVSGAETYVWSPLVDCLDPDCATVAVSPGADQTYTVTGISAFGCVDSTDFVISVVDESELVTETAVTCAGEPVDIFGELIDEAGVYCDTTELNGGCLSITCIDLTVLETSFTETSETICPGDSLLWNGAYISEAGTYEDVLTNEAGCDSTVVLNIDEYAVAEVALTPAAVELFSGQVTEVLVTGAVAGSTYAWAPDSAVSCADCPDPLVGPLAEDVELQVVVTDPNGCEQILVLRADITTDCEGLAEKIPNAFSPNGDGLNDRFMIPGAGFQEGGVRLEIWSRWGQLLYEDVSASPSWDGTYAGEPLPADVYVYRLFVVCTDAESVELSGEVTVVR